MKLFLDDIRSIPRGFEGVRGYSDCIRYLSQNKGKITEISLDHDLGEIRNGYDVCKWIAENEYYEGLERIIIHSANPVGVKNMLQLLDRYCPKNIELLYLDVNREYVKYFRT